MRTDPSRQPIDAEIESTFEANPGLREELDEAVRGSSVEKPKIRLSCGNRNGAVTEPQR